MRLGSSYNDTWALNFNSNTQNYVWTNITPTVITLTNNPSSRIAAAMAFDSIRGQIILFGGVEENETALNDTWMLSFNSISQAYTWTNLSLINSPSSRFAASMVFDEVSGQIILFGGFDANGDPLNDTWALSFDSTSQTYTTWENLTPTNSPQPRGCSSMVYDANNGQSVLFAGQINNIAAPHIQVVDDLMDINF